MEEADQDWDAISSENPAPSPEKHPNSDIKGGGVKKKPNPPL